jgi:hypothetical protein
MLFMQYGLKTHRFFRYDLSPHQHEPQILVALGSGKLSVPLYFNQLDLIQERWLNEVGEEKAAEILNNVGKLKTPTQDGNKKPSRDA